MNLTTCFGAIITRSALLATIGGLFTMTVYAQQQPGRMEVHTSIHNDTSEPLKSTPILQAPLERREIDPPRLNPNRTGAGAQMFAPDKPDTAIQSKPGPPVAITITASVDGLGMNFKDTQGHEMPVTSLPPDTNGAIGETQFVQVVNTSFAIFDKKDLTKATYGYAPINTIWKGFGAQCETNNDGDPVVQYDKIAKRWIISQFRVHGGGFSQCVAVSTSGDATGAYYRYEFTEPSMNDYPKIGVWPDGYYITYNMFGQPQGARVCVYERSKMLIGQPAREIAVQLSSAFFGLLPSDFDGVPDKGHLPPANSPCFFLSLGTKPNYLDLWKFRVNWADPARSTFGSANAKPDMNIPVAPFIDAPSLEAIGQLGTTRKLDGLGDRLMNRLAYRKFDDHESLVVNHSVSSTAIAGVRWYEIRDPNGAATVYQQGTFSPDATCRWMGSIAMNKAGNIALGYSASGSNLHPSIRVAVQKNDPQGTTSGILSTETTLLDSKSSQDGASRWGDYSSMNVDPVDDSTFYFTTEYLGADQNGSFNWNTRIVSFVIK
jgi:hypothetical protein